MLAVVRLQRPEAPPWYALRCSGSPHTHRALDLEPTHNQTGYLERYGIEAYFPMVRENRPVPRRALSHAQRNSGTTLMRPRLVPLLPGVVFVRGATDDPPEHLTDLPRVIGFISIGDQPAAIPHAHISELRGREVNGAIAGRTPARMIFKVGETARVTDGPFTSFSGKIVKVPDVTIEEIDGATRLKLLVNIFGRLTPVELNADQIEKV